ncbi:MAG: hypothetical protein LBV00_12830 [Propionibacteriaceae bacterium]|jgi:DNA-directed RNA polymerase specialized sigma24 family protein|nr:hypothetical protein [Propionibacteriaceae bacterium]
MQAMVSLLAHPPTGVRQPGALMVETAKRKAIDMMRSRDVALHVGWGLGDEDVFSDDVAHDGRGREQLVRLALTEVDRLPVAQRVVIRRVVMDGCSASEVAPGLGVTAARVCQLRVEALLVLRRRMHRCQVLGFWL